VTLDEVLRTVAERVPYLAASTVIEGDDWIGCDTLVTDPAALTKVVRASARGFGTDDEVVAASLFTESYAFRVAGTALVAFALDLPVPDLAPTSVAVRIDKPRPSAVAYLDPLGRGLDADALAGALIAVHLGPFVAVMHEAFRVGERNLWGNVAAACAVAFRAVHASAVGSDGRERIRARAEAFFDACAPDFDGLGAFTAVQHAGRQGWYWDRASCCLWFRTTGSELCDNCSLIDPSELYERRVAELSVS
jgi:ferric iron reductase protein FhuF